MAPSPTPLDRFLHGINNANLELMLSAFASDAEIVDDGKSFRGEGIQALCGSGIIGHHGRVEILERELRTDGKVFQHVKMDGDISEGFGIHEPFDLYLLATVEKDKIKYLEMGDVDPRKPTIRTVYAASGLHEIRYPMILGNEGAGILEDGTEVAVYPNLGDADFKGDETLDPKRHVLGEVVQGLDAKDASVMGIAWLTTYRMMFKQASLRPGQTVLVQGSSGGVTTAPIQLGSVAGFRVWATGRTEAKRALATRLGAERTFEPLSKFPYLVDATFDTSGAATISHSSASVKPGGTVVSCGIHSEGGSTDVKIDLLHILANQIILTGVYTGTREEFVDLLNFVVLKGIKPHIGKVLPLERADEGLKDIWEGKTEGKIVVTI
ncbi:hypothetical protein LTR20_000533 [Exophiala xenobiotica]|nr:hypothetical protein LTS13_004919 [Exophiala xenobiotica]KAK5396378.1 hypothetical protein LTR79_006106 [Exophiala xenobiotica]KAK5424742.1 hypothetical protein LTR90_000332 [Exophiala xenobiotica]KAK5473073.1 hypothetical protein LTR20_000533 [Exophiala xenobiotica]KAK5500640.1 hypothetical protein LTR26_000331 [Exophiala xenobiotica]